MLDLSYLRDHIETARQRLAGRGFLLDVETFQRLDGERKSIIHDVERLRQLRNSASEEIAKLLREKVDVTAKRNEMKLVSQQIKDKEEALRIVEEKLFQFASTMPNLPDPAVPVGSTDEQNVEVRRVGDPPRFDFPAKAHWDLCPPLGVLDLERATKITGSPFPLLAGRGARLERAHAGQQGNPRAGDFGGPFEIEDSQGRAKVPMGFRGKIEAWRIAHAPDLDILLVGGTDGNGRIRQIGHRRGELKQFFLDNPERLFLILNLLGYELHFVALGGDVHFLAKQFGDLFRRGVP